MWMEFGAEEASLREVKRRAWAGARCACSTAWNVGSIWAAPCDPWALPLLSLGWHTSFCLCESCCLGVMVWCHEDKWHFSRAFFRHAFPARAAKSKAASAGRGYPVSLRCGWGCRSVWALSTVTEADKTPSLGHSQSPFLRGVDLAELSVWIKQLPLP